MHRKEIHNRYAPYWASAMFFFGLAGLSTVCFAIEGAQYLALYDATFDPYDLLAYISILTPLYLIDSFQYKRMKQYSNITV